MAQPVGERKPFERSVSLIPRVHYKFVLFATAVGVLALMPVYFVDAWLIDEVNAKLLLIEPKSAMALQEVLLQFKDKMIWFYLMSLGLILVSSVAGGIILTQRSNERF
ncbi:MAG: hypothetical protein AB7N80_07110 [Bdellovibrionales bacterium]